MLLSVHIIRARRQLCVLTNIPPRKAKEITTSLRHQQTDFSFIIQFPFTLKTLQIFFRNVWLYYEYYNIMSEHWYCFGITYIVTNVNQLSHNKVSCCVRHYKQANRLDFSVDKAVSLYLPAKEVKCIHFFCSFSGFKYLVLIYEILSTVVLK